MIRTDKPAQWADTEMPHRATSGLGYQGRHPQAEDQCTCWPNGQPVAAEAVTDQDDLPKQYQAGDGMYIVLVWTIGILIGLAIGAAVLS